MSTIIMYFSELLSKTLQAVFLSLQHNWIVLAVTIMTAVLFKTYVDANKLSELLTRKKRVSVFASVSLGAFTPFCACGTTAVIIGMLTTALPWGAIMAFLTSSPLMSPDGFIMITGILGIRFALGLTAASLLIGISSGLITNVIESKTNFLDNQTRYSEASKESKVVCKCLESSVNIPILAFDAIFREGDEFYCCDDAKMEEYGMTTKNDIGFRILEKFKLKQLSSELIELGVKQILFFYMIFVAIGYLINSFVPMSIISVLFGKNSLFAIPLATLIGFPLYLTTESGVPIIQSMLKSGAGEGAMLAFMISGPATSAWVIAGLSSFLKKRAIMLYLGFIVVGSILSGYLYECFLYLGI